MLINSIWNYVLDEAVESLEPERLRAKAPTKPLLGRFDAGVGGGPHGGGGFLPPFLFLCSQQF